MKKLIAIALVLVLCLSFAVGPSFLKALNLAGKFPQLDYKITELEKLIEGFDGSPR